jgi:hypothetical protein
MKIGSKEEYMTMPEMTWMARCFKNTTAVHPSMAPNDKTITITLSDETLLNAIRDEIRVYIESALTSEPGISSTKEIIVKEAVKKLTDYENERCNLQKIIDTYITNVAVQYLARNDDEFQRKIEAHSALNNGRIADDAKIALYFDYQIEKIVRGEIGTRLENMEISFNKFSRRAKPTARKPVE